MGDGAGIKIRATATDFTAETQRTLRRAVLLGSVVWIERLGRRNAKHPANCVEESAEWAGVEEPENGDPAAILNRIAAG